MALEAAPTPLTTEAAVGYLLSSLGVMLAGDDDNDGMIVGTEQNNIDSAIEEGSDEAYQRLQHRYKDDVIATSRWVQRRVSYIVAHILGRRRGNPSVFCEEYERFLREFDKVQEGKLIIPRLKPRFNTLPFMSNVEINDRHFRRKARVDPETVVGGFSGLQDLDNYLGLATW